MGTKTNSYTLGKVLDKPNDYSNDGTFVYRVPNRIVVCPLQNLADLLRDLCSLSGRGCIVYISEAVAYIGTSAYIAVDDLMKDRYGCRVYNINNIHEDVVYKFAKLNPNRKPVDEGEDADVDEGEVNGFAKTRPKDDNKSTSKRSVDKPASKQSKKTK